jgi:hypothetical protein
VKPPKPTVGNGLLPTALKQSDLSLVPQSQVMKGRVDLQPDKFSRIIQQVGYPLVWTKALLCPCVSPASEQARVDCKTCDSSGYFYVEPIEVQGIMTDLESKKGIYRNLGEWLTGTAVMTVNGDVRFGYRDRFAMVHSVMVFNEWIQKGNRRGIRSTLPVHVDACRYKIVRMLHLMWEPVEDESPVALQQRLDFEVTDEGWIKWIGPGHNIPDGATLTAHYEFHPVWVVITSPHGLRDTVTRHKEPLPVAKSLPLRAAVKLDYLVDSKTLRSSGVLDADS